MGSQTLEILRQGVWASLTGGWFYDPRLDVFSNTFHLYIWLFLLCLPFTIYLYFPPDLYVWIAYCSTIIVLFGTIKIINNTLHSVYDTTEYLEEPSQNVSQQKPESEKKRDSRLKRRDQSQEQDFLGIELQVLNGKTDTPPVECSSRNSYIEQNVPNADADSITSDYTRDKPNSTIDLKVEIHRKNSSESSEEAAHLNKSVVTSKRVTNVHKAEMISKQDNDPDFRAKTNVKRNLSTSRKFCRYASEDASTARNRYPKSNMGKTGSESQIKQTSSMELEQPDDYEYWKYNQSVRRLNSTSIPMEMLNDHPQSLEIISIMAKKDDVEKDSIPSHPQSLEVISQMPHQSLAHPQSLEIIRAPSKMTNPTDDNNLPLYPQSLEMINSKKTLPQNTLKRNKLQLMPYLSCGSEIVHPIAEQSDEQIPSDNTGRYNEDSQPQDSLSPLLTHEEEERYLRYIVDTTVDNDSANSRDALLEAETKPSGSNNNRRFSNTSQSSWDLSDGERRKEKRRDRSKHRQQQQTSSQADDQTANSGSIVGIDWLFENGEGEPWTNKNLPSKDPDSGSSSTTTLSIENEVKRKLLPQQEHSSQSADVDSKRQQGAIPKQNKSKLNVPVSPVEETCSITESKKQNPEDIIRNVTTKKRGRTQNRERRNRWLTSLHAANASNAHNASPKMSTSLVPLGSTNRNHENRSGNTSVMLYRPLTSGSNQDIDGLPPPPPPGVPLLAAIMSHSNYTQRLSGAVALPDPHHHHHHHYHHHHHTQQQQHQHQFQHPQIRLQQQQIQAREDLRAAHLNEVRGSRSQRYKRLHRANRARRNRPRSGQQQTQQSQPSQQQEEEYITLSHFFHHHWPPIPPDTSEESAIRYFCNDRGQWLAYTIDDNSQSAACGPALLAGCELPVGARILTSEQNDQLVNRMLNQNLNRNAYYDGNYELTEIPDLSKNSYSSLSLNSAGLTVIIDTPSTESPPALTSPIHSVTNIASNNSGSSHSNAGSSTIASKLPTSTNQSMHLNAPNGRGSPYRTITDSLTDRNRRLQNLLGNLDATHPGSSSTNVDAAGNLLQPMNNQPNTTSENLSWNRFVTEFIGFEEATQPKPKPARHYYKWKIWKLPEIRVHFDRLSLVALLDRNLTIFESIVATLLAVMVAGLALIVLQRGFYKDIFAFIFCFVTAGCQYSLLKSVQPDAASPTHGFNRIVVFSRPVYYIICTSIVLILESSIKNFEGSDFRVYGMQILNYDVLLQSRDVMLVFLLCFPLIFSFGLFPQINTFVMYLCEHIDIHIFGGNATTSLVSSIYCLFRSVLTVMTLYGFAYGALMEPKSSQHILFSIFCGLLVAVSYHLSRSSSDPSVIFDIIKTNLWPPEVYLEERQSQIIENASTRQEATAESSKLSKSKSNAKKKDVKINMGEQSSDSELFDPLPQKLRATVKARLKNDLIVCAVIGILSFAIHASTVFTALQPEINPVLWFFTGLLGLLLHYIMPQMRKQLPWLCLSKPVLRNHEFSQFEVREPVKIMWFEKIYVYLNFFERNILYPVVFLGSLTESSTKISKKFGPSLGALIIVICGLKALRSSYSDSSSRYLVLVFSALLFRYDLQEEYSETFLIDYFITAIIFSKMYELLLKIRFIVTYIAPWQITWGSAFHAFAQPFSVPHSAMLFLQAGISALLSTPLNPVLGSAIFISSYVRPVKFWERDYKTRRVDHSNTGMAQHLERNLGADDNNLNSIFYEQLTRSLQHSLYGDLALGRWGSVEQGDCFLLASDYLNCLVHIVQLGNGLATYQLRGLEFRGTYCQQREVEAISEGIEDNDNCCCCEMGHFSHVLSVNAAFSQRWLAWEVASSKYVLEGYSISDNSAGSMLQVFDFRKVLVSYYVKSIIFYAIKSPKLKQWLTDPEIVDPLKPTLDKSFVDLDPVFNMNIDEDFDYRASGITRSSFCNIYLDWIQFCANEQDKSLEKSRDSSLVSLCLSLSLLGRRVLGAASHNTVSSVEFFLYGLHALFKGDFRITSARDEWVLHDIDLLNTVVAKGVRMALKLHQDHFMSPDTYEEASALHEAIVSHDRNLVISHEADPLWRKAILSGAPSLLALRHVMDDGIDEYKVIMLNKRFLSFRVIKMNRECVRGLWAGQQQELIYLRNRNPERGSIQNAKQALRNIINSSCDQPIGYPIYVSPLTTSYAETNEQLCSVIGGPLSFSSIRNNIFKLWRRVRRRCGQGCSSGGTGSHDDGGFGNDGVYAMTTYNAHTGYGQPGQNASGSQSMESGCQIGGSTTGRSSLSRGNTSSVGGCRGSLASMGKPTSSTLASLAGLLSNTDVKVEAKSSETSFTTKVEKEEVFQRVRIMDPNHVYDAINLGRRIDVIWPDEKMRQMGGRSGWLNWVPERGMEGCVVHRWSPNHRDPNRRSHVDKVILLVRIDEKYVPIAEQGVRDLGAEV